MRIEINNKNIVELLNLEEFKQNHVIILFLDFIKSIDFNKINNIYSILEIDTNLNDISLFMKLESDVSIPIEISITDKFLDFSVCGCPIYEMFEIKNKDFTKELEFIKKWFNYDIVYKVKYSGKLIVESKFYNMQNTNEIIFNSKSIFSFLTIGKREEIQYKSWMK